MKTVIYPGSFSIWHEGHNDILNKALKIFDHVVIAIGINHDKPTAFIPREHAQGFKEANIPVNLTDKVTILPFNCLLVDAVKRWDELNENKICAVVRGLRNGHDLQYETNQMYWHEDLGLKVPIIFFITDRNKSHISSSAIKQILKIKGDYF